MASVALSNPRPVAGTTEDLIAKIRTLDKKFRRACDVILLLNNQVEDLQIRYDRAMKTNRRSFRYSLRLRLATLEGVRNMFYEYASRSADDLEQLQTHLIAAGGDPQETEEEWAPGMSDGERNVEEDNSLSSSQDSDHINYDNSDINDMQMPSTSSSSQSDNSLDT